MKDSIDKIVESYFALVTTESFTYKGRDYHPQDLRVSPGIFRRFTCPSNCGGCCHRFSLDYLPGERRPDGHGHELREVGFNSSTVQVYTDPQTDHANHHCRNVNKQGGPQKFDPALEPGRCQIHGSHPFTCDFELLRFSQTADPLKPNYLNQRLYGRGWAMLRVDGERGARCEMVEGDPTWTEDTVRRLSRLLEWATHFGINTCIPEIIEWVKAGPHTDPLVIKNGEHHGPSGTPQVVGEQRNEV